MNFKNNYPTGKVVYWVNWKRFENSTGKRDGKDKAEEYCLDNFLNPADIQRFDSRTECDYYEHLLARQLRGEISNLGHHFALKIQDECVNANGDTVPPITYEADFIYKDETTGKRMVVDVKGSEYFIDERFITIKQVFDKSMKDKGLYIQVIMKKNNEWVEWKFGDKKKSQKLIKKQRDQIYLLKKQVHLQEKQEKQIAKDKAMIIRYREWKSNGHGLTKKQFERLLELEAKYKI